MVQWVAQELFLGHQALLALIHLDFCELSGLFADFRVPDLDTDCTNSPDSKCAKQSVKSVNSVIWALYGVSIKTVAILPGWSLSKHGQPIAVSGCANSLPTKAPNCCSLSPRERVRVRGKTASNLSGTATVFVETH
jgi:hypothetical protein